MTKKQRRFTHAVVMVLGAFALDCGLSDSDPAVGVAQFAYKSTQGERLQATALGNSWAVQSTGATGYRGITFDLVFLQIAELRAQRGSNLYTGAQLVGARLLGKSSAALPSADLEFFVRSIAPHNGAVGEFEYEVDYRAIGAATPPVRLCQDSGGRALPVTGTWQQTGAFVPLGAGQFSFACTGGVIVKCIDWGYKPWDNFVRPPAAPVALRPFHQSCTRMARADYCGDGNTFTIDGTPIDLYDRLPINTQGAPDPDLPPYFIESVWGVEVAGGARLMALKCLAKTRWDTLPIGGACPLKIPDPRVNKAAAFCENKTWEEWQAAGGIIANDSTFIDRGLFRWRKSGGEDHFSTSHYIHRGVQPSPTGPPPGGYQFVAFEGAVYQEDLGAAGLLPTGSLVPLYAFFSPSRGDHLTTTAEDPNTMAHPPWDGLPLDYGQRTLEGYVYRPPPVLPYPAPHPRAKLLVSWWSPSRRIHITSRTKPSPAMNDDFVMGRIEGYVIYKQ